MSLRRREFLLSATAVAGLAGLRRVSSQDARQAKLARIAMMTLNFTTLLKTPGQPPGPERTLDLFDLPQMYADTYVVHNIELQHYHAASTEPSYYKELRSRVDKVKSRITQVVVEFGGLNISAPDHNFLPRLRAIDLTKVWIDRCVILGSPRIMVNQGQPSQDNKHYAIETLKAMGDYGASKGVKVNMETRGGGAGRAAGAGASPPGATPSPAGVAMAPAAAPAEPAWVILNEIIEATGTYVNIDLGGIGAGSQEELHTGIRALIPRTSGSMHVKRSAAWDLPTALRFISSLRYEGLYSIEARGHDATRDITTISNIDSSTM
jgi:hypothetical protein